jgi:hypothetical protein
MSPSNWTGEEGRQRYLSGPALTVMGQGWADNEIMEKRPPNKATAREEVSSIGLRPDTRTKNQAGGRLRAYPKTSSEAEKVGF